MTVPEACLDRSIFDMPTAQPCDPLQRILASLAWLCQTLASLLLAWWPLLVLTAAMALLAGALLARVLRLRAERERAGAVFFEIVPPFRFPADGALPLWKMLAGVLHEQQRGSRGRVCLELWSHGRDRVVRAGLWVPATSTITTGDLTRALLGDATDSATGSALGATGAARSEARSVRRVATLLARGVARAWPGCGVIHAPVPRVPAGAVTACELVPRHGRWAALVDHHHAPARGPVTGEDEPLRAILDALADVARTSRYAALQVVVSSTTEARRPSTSTAPGLAGLAGGLRGGFDSAARRRLLVGVIGLLGRAVIVVLDEVMKALRELLSGPTHTPTTARPATRAGAATSATPRSHPGARSGAEAGPVVAARAKAWEAKQRSGPHLQATVRFVVAGTVAGPATDTAAGTARRTKARQAARELASMLSTLALEHDATRVRPVRAKRAARVAAGREHGRGFVASTRELAAVWHLPHHPARHRLPHPRIPDGSPNHDGLPQLDHHRDHRHRPHPSPSPSPHQPSPRPPHRLGPARPATSPIPTTSPTPITEAHTEPIPRLTHRPGARDAA